MAHATLSLFDGFDVLHASEGEGTVPVADALLDKARRRQGSA